MNEGPTEFYPFQEQKKIPENVPFVKDLEEHHEKHKPQQIPWLLIVLAILSIGTYLVYNYNQSARTRIEQEIKALPTQTPTPSLTPSLTPTPTLTIPAFTGALQSGFTNLETASSYRVGFNANVTTRSTRFVDNQTTTLTSKVEGYFVGASNGVPIQTELRITELDRTDVSVYFGQILVDGRLFIKRNSDAWTERNMSDYNKLFENQPIDATAYAYNMVDTIYTQSKALIRSINTESIRQESDEKINNVEHAVYTYQLSIPAYIRALKSDPETKSITITDSERILEAAQINGTIYVSKETNTISRIQVTATNLSQISANQARELGILTTHDFTLEANILDYNAPLSIQPPTL